MTAELHPYDLVLSSLKDPLPPPWSVKYREDGWSEGDPCRKALIIVDCPDYTAQLDCYRDMRNIYDTYASVTCFRKDHRNPSHEELVEVLSPLFSAAVALTGIGAGDQGLWVAVQKDPKSGSGFNLTYAPEPEEYPDPPPDVWFARELRIEPAEEPEHTLTGPDPFEG
jgi:hypothetical protein